MLRWMADRKHLKKLAGAVDAMNASLLVPTLQDGVFTLGEPVADGVLPKSFGNTKLPLKVLLSPRSETLSTYDTAGMTAAALSEKRFVVFGTRPCDAHSLLHLDKVFLDQKFPDPYYARRRDNTTIISLACTHPGATCFCTSVDGGPSDTKGSDVVAHELGDGLLFQSCTEKGERFLAELSGLLSEPDHAIIAARDKQVEAAETAMRRVDLTDIGAKLDACFASGLWQEVSASCLGCGVCTYLCPTCHCFAIHDDGFMGSGKRVRVQDSCMYPSFTAEASGHNPRARKAERVQQRIMHKFRYAVENFGQTFCVGCGRCIAECPVNIDVRETIAGVRA